MLKRLAILITVLAASLSLWVPAGWAASKPMHGMGIRGPVWRIRKPVFWNKRLLGTRTRVVYAKIGHLHLTFFIFRPRAQSAALRPVVVYIHGGALKFGNAMINNLKTPHNQLMVSVERSLIQHGVDFVTVNYRLAPVYRWPDALIDVKHAIKYMDTHSVRLGINPDQMAVMGDSAGGELSSFVGLTMDPRHRPVVRAVVDLFGPTNRRTFAVAWRRRHGLKPNPVYGVYTWKRVRRESAVCYVTPNAPPFLIVQGTRDHVVPPSQSKLLKDRLNAAGVPVREILVHHAGHELVAKAGPIHPGIPYIARQIEHFLYQQLDVPSFRNVEQERRVGG